MCQLYGCSTSGGWGLGSGASSLLDDRSAAFERRPAATSGLVVALANFNRVAAWSARYFFPVTVHPRHSRYGATTLAKVFRSGNCPKMHTAFWFQNESGPQMATEFGNRPAPLRQENAWRNQNVLRMAGSGLTALWAARSPGMSRLRPDSKADNSRGFLSAILTNPLSRHQRLACFISMSLNRARRLYP